MSRKRKRQIEPINIAQRPVIAPDGCHLVTSGTVQDGDQVLTHSGWEPVSRYAANIASVVEYRAVARKGSQVVNV